MKVWYDEKAVRHEQPEECADPGLHREHNYGVIGPLGGPERVAAIYLKGKGYGLFQIEVGNVLGVQSTCGCRFWPEVIQACKKHEGVIK